MEGIGKYGYIVCRSELREIDNSTQRCLQVNGRDNLGGLNRWKTLTS
jgi:hypothetical protein